MSQAFLGVETSLTGRRWVGPGIEVERAAEALAQETRLPLALCQVLARRGVAASDVNSFLNPTLRDLLPDPLAMKDMEKAAARFLQTAQNRQRIAVFGDYDVDGGASTALLVTWLRSFDCNATIYIPDRIDEGYGPNVPAMTKLAQDHDLIVCVDCGTLSHDALAAAEGADVIVLDHHLGGETLPPAVAVVNPNRQDESGDLAHLCAASVVFLMLVEVNRRLKNDGKRGPDLMTLLDLVALATVADVAPLIGVNRALVRTGLKVMAGRNRPGLSALSDIAGLKEMPRAYHLGYLLGPRINAGGRIGKADLGARLLSTDNASEAQSIAEKLDQLNRERREIEAEVTRQALEQAEERGFDSPLVWAAGQGWHPGVVGIVASRLKEATNRPSVVIGLADGIGKGSGRSIAGVDLGASIQRTASEGLLIKGGGHKMAAGLTVAEDQMENAMQRLSELLAKQGADQAGRGELSVDGILMPGAATIDLIERLESAGPFGASAPAPRFALPAVTVHFAKRVGENHLKLTIGDGIVARLDAIAFGAYDGPLGQALASGNGGRFHLAGQLDINEWNGRRSVQLRLDDASTVA